MVYNVGVALSTQRCAPFLLLKRYPNLEKHLKYNPPLPYDCTQGTPYTGNADGIVLSF